MRKKQTTLSDRERILTEIVDQLATTQLLVRQNGWGDEFFKGRGLGDTQSSYVHFAYWRKPVAGELVIGKTGSIGQWKIGWFVEPLFGGSGGAMIREIGSQNLCRYENEEFVPIVGLHKDVLLEGFKQEMLLRIRMAFRSGNEHSYRFGGADFNGDNDVLIWVRQVWGGLNNPSKPFSIPLKYNRQTSIKKILQAMRDGGYGTKVFELVKPIADKD